MAKMDWFINQNIPVVYCNLTLNDKNKKVPQGLPKGWLRMNATTTQKWNDTMTAKGKEFSHFAVNLGLNKEWMCIDVDNEKIKDHILKAYGDGWQTKSSTKKLPHLFRRRHADDPGIVEINKDSTGIDYLYNQVWETVDGEITGSPEECQQVYQSFEESPPKVPSKVVHETKPNTEEDMVFKKRILDNIDMKHWENRKTWTKLIWAMQHDGITEEVMNHYSSKATSFTDGCVQEILKDWDEDKSPTWGSCERLSHLSNPEEHAAICANRPVSGGGSKKEGTKKHKVSTDKFLALKALELVNGEIVKVGDMLYVYDRTKGYWEQDHKGCHTRVMISNLVDDWLIEELEPLKGRSDDAKPYNKAREKMSSNSGINNIYSIFKDTIPQNNTIEFDDTRPYYFVWSCGKAYDFESHDFVVLKKEDYVTMTTGYPYDTYTEEDLASLQTLYREIHFDDDTYIPYMSMCVTACIGIQVEKFIVNTGGGGNGKGVVNELLSKMLGNYFYKGSVAMLQEPIKAEQANPALASMHLKRLTICTEPEPGKKLNQATLKTITGDGDINARQLYSTAMKVTMLSTLVMECNQLPDISGKMDNSVKRRIRAIPFNATYTDDPNDPDLLAGKPHVHAANLLYKKTIWQNSKRAALFEMIRRFAKEHGTELLESETCKKRAAKYVSESDFAMVWFKDLYERVPNGEDVEPLPMIELFAEFKACDEYKNMDRDDKKYWTKKQLIEQLTEKLPKDDYHERKKWHGKSYRSAICNWRLIPED